MTLSQPCETSDLAQICKGLGARAKEGEAPPVCIVTSQGVDLLRKLLCLDQSKRISAAQALKHPYVRGEPH